MYVLLEQSDVFVDACAADHRAQLLFISVFGRDTSVQQLMARLHQTASQGGVDVLTLQRAHGETPALKVMVGDPRRLDKAAGRMPKTGLLGNLVHTWIFDPVLMQIDHATRSAWMFDAHASADTGGVSGADSAEVWGLVKDLSPVPLLDAWAEPVLDHVRDVGGLLQPPTLGAIRTVRIELPETFALWVSENLRSGHLVVANAHQAEQGQVRPVDLRLAA